MEAFSGFWDVLWVFFHEVSSDAQHALTNEFSPVELLHVKVEEFFVPVVELLEEILQQKKSVCVSKTS